MPGLRGQRALVTGGGRGIGRAVAASLTAAGAAVTVLGRSEAPLREAVAAREAAAYVVADVTDERAVAAAVGAAGPVDILVANAGAAESAPFATATAAQFERLFDVNVMGAVHAIHAVLGAMTARRTGRIVAVASTAGLKGYAYVSAYCTAKHALIGLVRALALETAKTGVTVNAVCPGYTDTGLLRQSIARTVAKTGLAEESILAEMLRYQPLERLIAPAEVAAAVLYLCSPEASAVNGTTLAVAGGEIG